jgi:hypothetical protein
LGPLPFEKLGRKAESAFNLANTRRVDSQLKIVQKVRGILNRISKTTYDVLSEEMWARTRL